MGVTFKGGRSPKTSRIRTDSVNYLIGVLSLKEETSMYGDEQGIDWKTLKVGLPDRLVKILSKPIKRRK